MATLKNAHKNRPAYRTTWAYRKKHPNYRALRLVLEVREPENLMFKEIVGGGKLLPYVLPKGKYEARVVPHPDPQKAGDREKRWIVVQHSKHIIGISKGYLQAVKSKGWARFYTKRASADTNGFEAKAAPEVVTRA